MIKIKRTVAALAQRAVVLGTSLLVLLAGCDASLDPEDADTAVAGIEKAGPAKHGSSSVNRQLAMLRRSTAQFHRTEAAQAAGYDLRPGLDHCFTNQPVGDMGYHYIDAASLDLTLEVTHPEAMVYAPGPGGKRHLAAVEYIVPAADWDAAHDALPSILGHDLHLNEALGVYVLHAWIWRDNPRGTFEDWNSNVTCD